MIYYRVEKDTVLQYERTLKHFSRGQLFTTRELSRFSVPTNKDIVLISITQWSDNGQRCNMLKLVRTELDSRYTTTRNGRRFMK